MNWFTRLFSGEKAEPHRASPPPAPPTFNDRVTGFWQWYAGVAPRLFATIEAGNCASLTDETSQKVNEFLPGFAWVYGRGANGKGHSFTLTGEGNIHRQLLAQQWLAQAPVLEGWTFYASRQAGPIKGQVIEMDGLRFDPKEIWITPALNPEKENIDITIWHPQWEKITDSQRSTITFLFLDEALGEYGTDWWIGLIDHGKDKLGGSFPLEELSQYVAGISAERGWKKLAPGSCWTIYRTKESAGDFPRADVLTQTTGVSKLFIDYMNSAGDFPDPLAGFGADYVFVSIERAFFSAGEEVKKRGEIEDTIERALLPSSGGRCVGGALGSERCYSDFLIFDGARSVDLIRRALTTLNVPAGTMIEFFAREKRGQRIAL